MILAVIKIISGYTLAIAVLYMLAIMPRIFHRPDTTLFQKRYFAHRGLHDNAADAPVIFHDFTLNRICGAEGKPAACTYEELQAYTLCNSREHIPRLAELLAMVDGRVRLIS